MSITAQEASRTTITFPKSWNEAIKTLVSERRRTTDPGARPNDIYREALRQYLISKGYLKDGDNG